MLNKHKKRELRQLWFGASYYLQLAKELKGQVQTELDRTTAEIADAFSVRVPGAESPDYKLAVLGAHIASAGIRLGSVHEVLDTENHKRCRDILKEDDADEVISKLDASLTSCVSILLRDNVAHVEGDNPKWKRRENYLAKKTYRQLYEAVVRDLSDTTKQLETKGVL